MTNEEDISRKEINYKVLDAVKENIEILEETDMDSLGKMDAHLLNITMVLCDISRSLAFIADNERRDLCEAEWIDNKCSNCGKGIEDLIYSREWYENEKPNFCPFCGKKFKESEVK